MSKYTLYATGVHLFFRDATIIVITKISQLYRMLVYDAAAASAIQITVYHKCKDSCVPPFVLNAAAIPPTILA